MSIKIENTILPSPEQWNSIILSMRNPMNSWEKSDSYDGYDCKACGLIERKGMCEKKDRGPHCEQFRGYEIGPNDLYLMMRLRNAGTDHRKFMRMITVYVDITAPLYWWKEFDTYKVGTVANSCSTMHKIQAKEFTLDDFSHENLFNEDNGEEDQEHYNLWLDHMKLTIIMLNRARERYLETKDKKYWWQMIQLLPSSYNQKRTVMLNYEVLANMYKSRKGHKLDEWREFCKWVESLPYNELICGPEFLRKKFNLVYGEEK